MLTRGIDSAYVLCVAQTFGALEKPDTSGWRVFSVNGIARDQQYNDAEFRATVVLYGRHCDAAFRTCV